MTYYTTMLMVHEIFYSIQGETLTAGLTSAFVRLTGCNLRCAYCDTTFAWDIGLPLSIGAILEIVEKARPFHHITVTGGEPLYQDEAPELLSALLAKGYNVQVETNGSIDLSAVPEGVRKIVDIKTPSSLEAASFRMENLSLLCEQDEVKFVISDRADFDFARDFIKKHMKYANYTVDLSPAFGFMTPEELSGLILKEKLNVRLNLQLHKIIWAGEEESKIVLFSC